MASCEDLVKDVCKVLKKTEGASADYQEGFIESQTASLARDYQGTTNHVIARRGVLYGFGMPDAATGIFLVKLENHELLLGLFSRIQDHCCAAVEKDNGAVDVSVDVEKFSCDDRS